MPESWSHLTGNLTSTTPGYLGEVYSGNLYQVKSDPVYGPNRGPSAQMIDKALSPAASIKTGEVRDTRCWGRLKRSSRCIIITTVLIALFFIIFFTVVGLIGMRVIMIPTPETEYERIYSKLELEESKHPRRQWSTSDSETAAQDTMPTPIFETQVIPTTIFETQVISPADSITSGFVTLVRPAVAEPTQLQ